MNKEVIYLEPEDDITDILTKLQQAEQKLVALVPPKKATMLRSAVNMKLVARVAKECEKVAVIVTADPAIIKMAMAAKIPVAKTLQSRPMVPTEESLKASEREEQVIDEETGDFSDEKPEKSAKSKKDSAKMASKASDVDSDDRKIKGAETIDLTEESLENDGKDPKNGKKPGQKSKNGPKVPSFEKYRKWIMIGVPAAIVLIIALVWAFVFAPAATITVAISSTSSNFNETVRFTTDQAAENLSEGVFYTEQITLEEKYNTEFTATGEEDKGDKAKGTLRVVYSLYGRDFQDKGFSYHIPEGEVFTTSDGLKYRATTASTTFSWDGGDYPILCDSQVRNPSALCTKTFEVPVEAVEGGEKYNISAGARWSAYDDGAATVNNPSTISGGTTHMVKVVSEDDIKKVKETLVSEHESEGRSHLFEDLGEDVVTIDPSFKAEPGDADSTPAVGDEVGSSTTPKVTVPVKYSVYVVSKDKIEEYIKSKADLEEGQKIYSIGSPYFERFTSLEENARLKTTLTAGPTVTEDDIFEKVKGHKTGEVQSLLRPINGVSSVEVRTPYFWVWSVPNDRSKVTIILAGEDEKA